MLEENNKTPEEVEEEALAAIWDAERKARALLDEMQITCPDMPEKDAPGFYNLSRYRNLIEAGRYSYQEPIIMNTERWICSYGRIVIKLDIMADYLEIVEKAIKVLEGISADQNPDTEEIDQEATA